MKGRKVKEVVKENAAHLMNIMNIHIAWRCEILDGLELFSGEVSFRKL